MAQTSPRILPADSAASIRTAVEEAARAIRAGLLVAVPTETVYGLACALNDESLELLLRAKGRPREKGITLLVDSLDQVESVATVSAAARALAERFWPGPLTMVLPAEVDAGLPMLLTGPQFTVGVRLPDHDVPRSLARELGPLPLTSANRSGTPDARDAAAVIEAVGDSIALVLDAGPARGGVPSTVVALEDTGMRVLRVGAISSEELSATLR